MKKLGRKNMIRCITALSGGKRI